MLVIGTFHGLQGQNFEWAASASGLPSGYRFATTDSTNNIIVGGSITVPRIILRAPNSSNDINVAVYDGHGDNVDVELYKYSDILMNFASNGSVNWWVSTSAEHNELVGIAHQGGLTALLIMVDDCLYGYEVEELAPMGCLPDFFGEDSVKHGLNIIFLDSNGNFAKHQTIFEDYHAYIDVSDFKAHPSGGYVLAGEADEGLIAHSYPQAGYGGASVLLKLTEEGKPEWMKVVSGIKPASGSPKIAISDKGEIYIGGMQRKSEKYPFPKGYDFAMTKLLTDDEHTEYFDSYIASYSSAGHFNWVTKIGERAILKDFAFNNNRILAGWMSKTKQPFEKNHPEEDEEEEEQYYFTRLSGNGKVLKEQIINPARDIYDICPHPDRGFYITQLSREIVAPRSIHTVEVHHYNRRKSELMSQLPPAFGTGEYAPQLQINSKNDVFFVGGVFSGVRTMLSTVDSALNKAESRGNAMVVGKLNQ